AGDTVKGYFEYVPVKAGRLWGYVEINDTNLRGDNRCYFSTEIAENINCLFLESDITNKVKPWFFVKMAVDPVKGGSANGIKSERMFIQELSSTILRDQHVVVLTNPDPIDRKQALILEDYMKRGGTIISFAGSRLTDKTFAQFSPEIQNIYSKKESAKFKGLDFKSDLAELNELLDMDMLQWKRYQLMKRTKNSTILAEKNGLLLVIDHHFEKGRWISLACSGRRDYTNWPELKSFPVMLIHLFNYASQGGVNHRSANCGQQVLLASDKKLMLRLNKENYALQAYKGELRFKETWKPGILEVDNGKQDPVVINPDTKESHLKRSDPAKAKALLSNGSGNILRTKARLDSQISHFRKGSDLSGIFLLLAFILFIAELLLGNRYAIAGLANDNEKVDLEITSL
ncbi:MAG: hypothetical protein HRT89_22935, partial [Lentisphaeria bacterium]|nr:hypothetical protein [Lentisphaeria bacterium]